MRQAFWPVLAVVASLASASGAAAQIKMGVAGPITGGSAAFGALVDSALDSVAVSHEESELKLNPTDPPVPVAVTFTI